MNFTALLPIIGVINFRLRGKLSLGRSLESFFVFCLFVCLFFFSFVCSFVFFFLICPYSNQKSAKYRKRKTEQKQIC